jgi:hypothetical protein
VSDQGSIEKKSKHRSPNYPVVSLKRALEMIKGLYDIDRRQKVPINIACKRWGYKEDSSTGQQAVAALSAYGLLDVEGAGPTRKVSVTEIAFKYLHSRPEIQKDMLRRFALSPNINLRVWEDYGHEIPQDDVLREHLIVNLRFNPETVGSFISRFKETIQFAELLKEDYPSDEPDEMGGSSEEIMDQGPQVTPPKHQGIPLQSISTESPFSNVGPVRDNQQELRFIVASGEIVMRVPASMTALDFEILQVYLQGLGRKLLSKPQGGNEQTN